MNTRNLSYLYNQTLSKVIYFHSKFFNLLFFFTKLLTQNSKFSFFLKIKDLKILKFKFELKFILNLNFFLLEKK